MLTWNKEWSKAMLVKYNIHCSFVSNFAEFKLIKIPLLHRSINNSDIYNQQTGICCILNADCKLVTIIYLFHIYSLAKILI